MGEKINQVVLDTDCLIQLEKRDPSVAKYLDEVEILLVTSVTVFEFAAGDLFNEADSRLEDYIVISFNKQDGLLAAEMLKRLRKIGKEVEFRDVMIAAICINNKVPLLTRNKKHFERFVDYGLRLLEW
jgi:predicted nucleic acid-binding protein